MIFYDNKILIREYLHCCIAYSAFEPTKFYTYLSVVLNPIVMVLILGVQANPLSRRKFEVRRTTVY